LARNSVYVKPKTPGEKDPVVVHDRHDGDGSIEDPRGYRDDILERSIGWEPCHVVTPKRSETLRLTVASFLGTVRAAD
jgi:hypothetical protein